MRRKRSARPRRRRERRSESRRSSRRSDSSELQAAMGDAGSIEEQVAALRKQIPGFDDFCGADHSENAARLDKTTTRDLLGNEGDGPRRTVKTGKTKSMSQHERDGHAEASDEEEVSDDNEESMFDKEQEEEEDSEEDSDMSESDKKKKKKKKGKGSSSDDS